MSDRMLRRKSDGAMFKGIRYGGEFGEIWEGGMGLTEVRDFVLNTKTDRQGLSNEHLGDVVKPSQEFVRGKGFLSVEVLDPDNNIYRNVNHGDWILKPATGPKYLMVVPPNVVMSEYEVVYNGTARIEYDAVMKLMLPTIESVMPALDENLSSLAQLIADKLYMDGWRRR